MLPTIHSSLASGDENASSAHSARTSRVRRAVQLLWCTVLLAPSLTASPLQAQGRVHGTRPMVRSATTETHQQFGRPLFPESEPADATLLLLLSVAGLLMQVRRTGLSRW